MSSTKLSGLQMWNELVELAHKAQEWPVAELSLSLGTNEEDLKSYLSDISNGNDAITFFSEGHDEWVKFEVSEMHFILPLNYEEWKALRTLFNSVEVDDSLRDLKDNFLSGAEETASSLTVFSPEEAIKLYSLNSELIHSLHNCITEKKAIYLQTDHKTLHIYPNRLIHLEGELCLIAEDNEDHCLTALSLSEVLSHKASVTPVNGKVSNYEIEEFISAIRSMNDQETRLILKIHDPDSVNLFPDYHFLGKPCMVKNPNGDLIWAAYVEPCSYLYEWLISLGRCVEILDPVSFKKDYLDYCEEKIRNIA